MWETIKADLMIVIQKIEAEALVVGKEFWKIVKNVFKAEEQVIMEQLGNMLKNDAISLQNAQPGINSKDAELILKNNAEAALATLGANLAYTGILTTIGTVMHDLGFPDTTGNAGTVS